MDVNVKVPLAIFYKLQGMLLYPGQVLKEKDPMTAAS